MVRFGKSAGALFAHKRSFFSDNARLVAESKPVAALYSAQPRRERCKCCDHPLGDAAFVKNGIAYALCARCGHLNGLHEDTPEFCAAIYAEKGGSDYARAYSASDRDAYWARVKDIYVPKAEFLHSALAAAGETMADLAVADFGAGSGYFVAALRQTGFTAEGYEVSATQAALAEAFLGAGAVRRHALGDTLALAAETRAPVVSMIGVLEHVAAPRALLAALRANRSVRYLYISVPLFSPCVFFELAFPGVFQRHLAGGHTHLFTERSLDWMCGEFGMSRVGEWWFGADMMDLFRAVSVELGDSAATAGAAAIWSEMFAPAIDDLQLALDQRRLASEVHMLLRFVR
ncbi:MAG TPA: methyltransferase domain-containing protein [Stellaceae bacterium]|nr:methyltransferase domain-containing protein [Stellaceae bacterium]